MKLLRPLPANRTFEQVQHHYLIEKAIAERLKIANREERRHIYATMYDELFREVPDHSRLTRRADEQLTRAANLGKLALVRDYLTPRTVFVEFAPGDCRFALEVAHYVKAVYAVDISNQRGPILLTPENFTLIIYDGYHLDSIPSGCADLVFSDQLIEHLHPEDTRLHFEMVYQLLKPGGKYVFRTPQALTGPHDVSKYFSEKPQGFHLKEWTYREFQPMLKELNFSGFQAIRQAGTRPWHLPYLYFQAFELILAPLSRRYRRLLAQCFVPSICITAVK